MLSYNWTQGKGAPVVVMHGWGCSRSTVSSIERIALNLGLPVLNVDFPGFGESPEPDSVWGTDDYSRQIEGLLDRLGIGPDAVLIGHSFGGRVAITIASRRKVGKVVLVDAAGVKPKRSLKYYAKVYAFKAQKHLLRLLLGQKKAEERLNRLRAKAGSSDYAGASPRMRQILSRVVNEDLTGLMPKITAPTLMVWGEEDTATPLSDARRMEQLIPGSAVVSFPGAGHYSFLDRPAQFAAVLESFLKS